MSSKTKSKKFVYQEGITKKYEVLQEAMRYLAVDGSYDCLTESIYICNCINKVTKEDWNKNHKDKSGLISIINARMNNRGTLDAWLRDVHGIKYAEMDADNRVKLQETRRQWMQSMYEEFKAKDE